MPRSRISSPPSAKSSLQDRVRAQRPWASTSTKTPAYSDTLYVDEPIGPDPQTLPGLDRGVRRPRPSGRTVDQDVDGAREYRRFEALGVSTTISLPRWCVKASRRS